MANGTAFWLLSIESMCPVALLVIIVKVLGDAPNVPCAIQVEGVAVIV